MDKFSKKAIDFEYLRSFFTLKSQERFEKYLETIFPDFCTFSNGVSKGITKTRFFVWTKLPIFICEKLFMSFDLDNDGFLSIEELKNPLSKLYFGSFKETAIVIFNFYDFDKDGEIMAKDVKTVLAFLPLKSDKTKTVCKYQLESLEELDQILQISFKEKEKLNFKEFLIAIQEKSDIYLQMLCFLYKRCPFQEKIVKRTLKIKSLSNKTYNHKFKNLTDKKKVLPIRYSKESIDSSISIKKPSKYSHFSPAEEFINSIDFKEKSYSLTLKSNFRKISLLNLNNNEKMVENQIEEKQLKQENSTGKRSRFDSFSEENSPEFSGLKGMLRFSNKNSQDKQSLIFDNDYINSFSNYRIYKTAKQLNSNSTPFPKKNKSDSIIISNRISSSVESSTEELDDDSLNKFIDFPEEKNDIIDEDDLEVKDEGFIKSIKKLSDDIIDKKGKIMKKFLIEKDIVFQGNIFMYKNEGMYSFWLVLMDQNIYYYSDEKKEDLTEFHHISGCFIRENGKTVKKNETYYSFSIIFSNKTRTYFTKDRDNAKEWSKQLRQSIGYLNFFDFYQIIDDIGKGSFGDVKLGQNTKTKEKVAIKIIDKKRLKVDDLELVEREIAIMKSINHPNTISFVDHFENSEYFFIVMEYVNESLNDYIKTRNKLTEHSYAKIIYQVASGLKYLHEFGIIHRDIKPDNILMDSSDVEVKAKIADFGLSKILSPRENTSEGFGTIVFIAPEILLRKPYNNSVDIWSLGVMTYFIVTKTYPFYDENLEAKVIASKIIHKSVKFRESEWKSKSKEVIEFIKLCLEKDFINRINIDQVLSHKWLDKRLDII